MPDPQSLSPAFRPARWLVATALLLTGVALFLALGPRTAPIVRVGEIQDVAP